MYKTRDIALFILFSLLLHVSTDSLLGYIPLGPPRVESERPQKKGIEIDLASPDLMETLRNVGKKGGSKSNQIMVEPVPQASQQRLARQEEPGPPSVKRDQVRTKNAAIRRKLPPLKVDPNANVVVKRPVVQNVFNDSLSKYGPRNFSATSKFAKGSNLGIHFEVPEGVDISELNESEMVFYSFKKRIAQTFINTLFNVYDKFSLSNPHVHLPVAGVEETLTGQLTFDHLGKIDEVKIMKGSDDSKTQEFFEEVLDNVRGLPNPPKALINSSQKFVVYFSLVMNGD